MTSLGDFRIPITIHLHVHTVRAIQAAAKRASEVAGRKVEARELIEQRLEAAVRGIEHLQPQRPAEPVITAEMRARLTNGVEGKGGRLTAEGISMIHTLTAAGKSAAFIAEAIGCHPKSVAYHRRKAHEIEELADV